MATYKISQLTTATAVSATNQFEINQNGTSKSVEVSVIDVYIKSISNLPVVVSVSSASNALLITQTGTGNALLVEDSANPDATPFVIDASGNVGIGTSSPDAVLTVNTIASFGAGAAALPSIAAKGDLNTGLWFPAADTIAASTGGSERLRIDSSGNVGIGTSSPGAKLSIVPSQANANISLGNTLEGLAPGTTNGGAIYFGLGVTSASTPTGGIEASWGTSGAVPQIHFGLTRDGAKHRYSAFYDATLRMYTSDVERMRIDGSGNVGIGTSSPGAKLDIAGNIRLSAASPNIEFNNGGAMVYGPTGNTLAFATGGGPSTPTERMRIDSSGHVQINTTNAAATGATCRFTIQDGAAFLPFGINNNAAGTSASNVALFARNGTTTGTISVTGTTTAYNTSSDYRLKHDVQPMLSGLSTISALKPLTYKWNADNSPGEGFIAHELQAVIPQAVIGEKDAVNDDGSIKSQGVDYSKIVVHLVAAIQELSAKVAVLEGKQ